MWPLPRVGFLPLEEGCDTNSESSRLPGNLWRLVVPIFDLGEEECEANEFYGANMAIRLSALKAVGGFDIRLGPGALGFYEDIELAHRLRHAGFELRYNPSAIVYHRVREARLGRKYLLERALALGRSARVAGLAPPLRRECVGVVEAAFKWLAATLLRRPYDRLRAENRIARHVGSFQERLLRRRAKK